MKISLLKKVFLRIVKHIQINNTSNISIESSAEICQNSILNASKGKILLGKHTRIGNSSELVSAENKQLIIKDYSTIYSNCKLLGDIEIERYCTLATNIYMSSGNHYAFFQPELIVKIQDKLVLSSEKGKENHNKKIHIHEDVWIGNGAFIASGVTIGRGAVIGSSSVVTKDIEPYSVMVGTPARKIKSRLNYSPPIELNCEFLESHPYFYNGFNHYNLPEITQQKGFELFQDGEIHINKDAQSIDFSGLTTNTLDLEIKINNTIYTKSIPAGDFSFNLSDFPTTESDFLRIYFSSSSKNSVYLKRVKLIR